MIHDKDVTNLMSILEGIQTGQAAYDNCVQMAMKKCSNMTDPYARHVISEILSRNEGRYVDKHTIMKIWQDDVIPRL